MTIRAAWGYALLAALLTVHPAAAGEKVAPKLTKEAKEGLAITQENIVKLKLRSVQPPQPPLANLPQVPQPPQPPN